MLNQRKDNRTNRKTAEISVNNIVTEVNENAKRLKDMLTSHNALNAIIDSVINKQLPDEHQQKSRNKVNFEQAKGF